MRFVYIHILWFGCWIGFGVENYPYGLLTMIVSLEAIFLSTFVMISQNRADAKRQAIADQQWQTVQEEERQNQELLALSQQILDLTRAIHAATQVSHDRQVAARSRRTSVAAGADGLALAWHRSPRSLVPQINERRCDDHHRDAARAAASTRWARRPRRDARSTSPSRRSGA